MCNRLRHISRSTSDHARFIARNRIGRGKYSRGCGVQRDRVSGSSCVVRQSGAKPTEAVSSDHSVPSRPSQQPQQGSCISCRKPRARQRVTSDGGEQGSPKQHMGYSSPPRITLALSNCRSHSFRICQPWSAFETALTDYANYHRPRRRPLT